MSLAHLILALQLTISLAILTCCGVGIYLAFSASVILGVASILLPPAATITGLVYLVSGLDAALSLASFLGL